MFGFSVKYPAIAEPKIGPKRKKMPPTDMPIKIMIMDIIEPTIISLNSMLFTISSVILSPKQLLFQENPHIWLHHQKQMDNQS